MRISAIILSFFLLGCVPVNLETSEKKILSGNIDGVGWEIREVYIKSNKGRAQCENFSKVVDNENQCMIYGLSIENSIAELFDVSNYNLETNRELQLPQVYLSIIMTSEGKQIIVDSVKMMVADTIADYYNFSIQEYTVSVDAFQFSVAYEIIEQYRGVEGKPTIYSDGRISSEAGPMHILAQQLEDHLNRPFVCPKEYEGLSFPFDIDVSSLTNAINELGHLGIELKTVSKEERRLLLSVLADESAN